MLTNFNYSISQENKRKQYFLESFILALLITGFLLTLTILFTDSEINIVENLAVFFSFACTWLCTRQIRFNYVLAVISTGLLSYVFYKAQLYGSMVLNIYLIPTVIYGWFVWGKDTMSRPVEHLKASNAILYILVSGITWIGAYLAIDLAGGEMSRLDGSILVLSILAQFLMDRKKLEAWVVWSVVNIISIYVYFNNGLYILTGQFFFFLINSVIAWFFWKKTMSERKY